MFRLEIVWKVKNLLVLAWAIWTQVASLILEEFKRYYILWHILYA
jgi:hypothetical protein